MSDISRNTFSSPFTPRDGSAHRSDTMFTRRNHYDRIRNLTKNDNNDAKRACRLQDLCPEDRAKLNRLILELAATQQALTSSQQNSRSAKRTEGGTAPLGQFEQHIRLEGDGRASSVPVKRLPDVEETRRKTRLNVDLSKDQRVEIGNQINTSEFSPVETLLTLVANQQAQIHELNRRLKKVTRLLVKTKNGGDVESAIVREPHAGITPAVSARSIGCQTSATIATVVSQPSPGARQHAKESGQPNFYTANPVNDPLHRRTHLESLRRHDLPIGKSNTTAYWHHTSEPFNSTDEIDSVIELINSINQDYNHFPINQHDSPRYRSANFLPASVAPSGEDRIMEDLFFTQP